MLHSKTSSKILFQLTALGLLSLAFSLTVSISGTGCTSAPIDENNPESLYRDAEEDIKSDHYLMAIDKLKSLKNKFPYSKYAVEAQLKIADVYFTQESFPEAAASYEAFHDLHPKHEKSAYALYRAGKSYLNDIPGTVARDLTPAVKAMEVFQNFLRTYPSAPEAEDARKDISEIRNLLANKELYIGDFYFKRALYDSAKPRYKKIVELYSETQAAKTAQEKLIWIEDQTKDKESSKNGDNTVKNTVQNAVEYDGNPKSSAEE